jgi:hypothetical protein
MYTFSRPPWWTGENFLIHFLYSLSQYVKILCNVNQLKLVTHCKTTLRWLLRRGSPLPIPNREVKPASADGTAICGRVCRRLSLENPSSKVKGFFITTTKSRVP